MPVAVQHFEDVAIRSIDGWTVDPDDPSSAGLRLILSTDPPEEWAGTFEQKCRDSSDVLARQVSIERPDQLQSMRGEGAFLEFWTDRGGVLLSIQSLQEAIEETNSEFRREYSELLAAQDDLNERIREASESLEIEVRGLE